MFKPLLRLTLATLLWRNYKRSIVATILALALILFTSLIHSDYLQYAQTQGSAAAVGWSYVIKWSVFLTILLVWTWAVFRTPKINKKTGQPDIGHLPPSPPVYENPNDDPFAKIRQKDTLKSRADLVIEQHKE